MNSVIQVLLSSYGRRYFEGVTVEVVWTMQGIGQLRPVIAKVVTVVTKVRSHFAQGREILDFSVKPYQRPADQVTLLSFHLCAGSGSLYVVYMDGFGQQYLAQGTVCL